MFMCLLVSVYTVYRQVPEVARNLEALSYLLQALGTEPRRQSASVLSLSLAPGINYTFPQPFILIIYFCSFFWDKFFVVVILVI